MLSLKSLLLLPAIAILFGIASLMVFATDGKDRRWLGRKLKFGGILFSLMTLGTGSASCGFITCHDAVTTDYLPLLLLEENSNEEFLLEGEVSAGSEKEVSISVSGEIQGTIKNREGSAYSCFILDESDNVVQSDDIVPLDGAFDGSSEKFLITLEGTLVAGDYTLLFFSQAKADTVPGASNPKANFTLHVLP